MKFGLSVSQSTLHPQDPKSQFFLVKQSLTGRPAPPLQQLQYPLAKLGFLGLQSTVPRRNPILQCLLWVSLARTSGTISADASAVSMTVDEARPLKITQHSAKTEYDLVKMGLLGPEQVARPVPTFHLSQ